MFRVIKHSACRGENTLYPSPSSEGYFLCRKKVFIMNNSLVPKIVGLVNSNLECVYAAIIVDGVTTVKHLVIPANEVIPTDVHAYVEMTVGGYSIKPVTLTDSFFKNFKETRRNSKLKPVHWAVNWFKADYTRWLIVGYFSKKELTKIFIKERHKENYSQPTTKFINTVTITQLLAAHVSYAHCSDWGEGEIDNTVESLLDVYIDEFKLMDKHGKTFRKNVLNMLDRFMINDVINKATPSRTTFGVDTFI